MRSQKLRLIRYSEAVRRDDALRTTRHRLRRTDHWSLIDERRRRAFQQLCDDVRRERLDAGQKSSSAVEPFRRCSADQTRTERTDEGPATVPETFSSSASAKSTTTSSADGRTMNAALPTSTEVVAPLCVTLHVAATSNSTSGTRETVQTTAALCITTVGMTTTTTCVQLTSVARQSYVTVTSSTAARCVGRSASTLQSPAPHGRVTFDELPTAIPTTNGVVDSNDNKDDDDRCSVVAGSTSSARMVTLVCPGNVVESRSLMDASSKLSLASSGVRPPPLKSFGNDNKTDVNDGVRRVVGSTRSAPNVGGVKENVPPTRTVVNGGDAVARSTRLERVGRPASATHQHPAVNQGRGWSSKDAAVASSVRIDATRFGRVPPPVPARTSSVLTGGGAAARLTRPATSWQAKSNGHLFQCRVTPPPAPRSVSVPPESTISNNLSRRSAFIRDKSSITGSVAEITTETEIH